MLAAAVHSPEPAMPDTLDPGRAPDEGALRAGAWSLIGALLRDAPGDALLARLRGHETDAGDAATDAVGTALRLLGLAAREARPSTLADEYFALFVGIGRGELVPYGSWYLTGFLMERPLSELRDDLARLGFARHDDVAEPEDHAAALAEVMAMLAADGADHETQKAFFGRHVAPWIGRFFADLQSAQSACFYRAVGRFGGAFVELESRYFSMRL